MRLSPSCEAPNKYFKSSAMVGDFKISIKIGSCNIKTDLAIFDLVGRCHLKIETLLHSGTIVKLLIHTHVHAQPWVSISRLESK